MEFLIYQSDATETKDAVRAVLTEDEIGTVGTVSALDAIAGAMTVDALAALCALATAGTSVAMSAKKTVLAIDGEHTVEAARASPALVGTRIVLPSAKLFSKFGHRILKGATGSGNVLAHCEFPRQVGRIRAKGAVPQPGMPRRSVFPVVARPTKTSKIFALIALTVATKYFAKTALTTATKLL